MILYFFRARKNQKRSRELYSLQDATIAASYSQLAAENLSLGSCWVGAFKEEKVKRTLGVEKSPVAIITIGILCKKSLSTIPFIQLHLFVLLLSVFLHFLFSFLKEMFYSSLKTPTIQILSRGFLILSLG